MKKITKMVASIIFMAISTSSFAQFNTSALGNKFHEELSSSCDMAKTQALAIVKDTSKSTADKLKNAEAVLKNLEASKKSHESIKSTIPASKAASVQAINATVEKHHAEATKLATALKAELQKQKPDAATINDYTKKLTASIDEMEKAHQGLKAAIK
jgi:hypothetical protein